MARSYETVCIVRTDAGDDTIKGIIQKASGTVETMGGKVNKLEEWGRRRLAYPIKKKHEGFYFLLNYTAAPEVSKEVERQLKFNEDVIRYQTINLEAGEEGKKEAPSADKGGEHGQA